MSKQIFKVEGLMVDYKVIALKLIFAFDRVRKYGITNDLKLEEELSGYLTKEELSEMIVLYNKYSDC
jgi:hypothetical protein